MRQICLPEVTPLYVCLACVQPNLFAHYCVEDGKMFSLPFSPRKVICQTVRRSKFAYNNLNSEITFVMGYMTSHPVQRLTHRLALDTVVRTES